MIGARISDEASRVLAQAKSPVVAACYEHWLQKRAQSGWSLPGRQHLDLIEMKGVLPHLVLIDVVRHGVYHRLRIRFSGTYVTDILGRDVAGLYIEHSGYPHAFDELYRRFSTVVDEKALVYGVSPSPARHLDFLEYEHLTLPLAADGQTVDMLFGVSCALPYSKVPARHEYGVAPLIEQPGTGRP